jgi:AcrR family transcriptional regulator
MFAERGFHATSLREIATRLGLSKAALHYHFPAKEDLLDALLEPAFESVEAVIHTAPAPPLDHPATRALLTRYQEALLGAGSAMQVLDGDPSALVRPSIQRRVLKQLQAMETLLAGPDLDQHRRLRARAALGVLHATCIAHPTADDSPRARPLAEDHELGDESIEAALAALGR